MRWNITPDDCEEALGCTRELMRSGGERAKASGVKSMIQMMGQNQKDEHHSQGDILHVEGAVDVKAIAERLEENPDFTEYQRRRACESDTDAGAVCQISDGRNGQPVANGSPSKPTRPGSGPSSNGAK